MYIFHKWTVFDQKILSLKPLWIQISLQEFSMSHKYAGHKSDMSKALESFL